MSVIVFQDGAIRLVLGRNTEEPSQLWLLAEHRGTDAMGKPRWLDASETIKQRILRDAVVDLANRLGITPESVASSACPRESEVDEPGPHVAPAPPPDEEAALVAGAVEGELHACDNPRDPADDIA